MEAEAEAEAVALKGDAEAYAIEIKAKAEVSNEHLTDEVWNYVERCASCILKAAVIWPLSIMIIDVLLIACSV